MYDKKLYKRDVTCSWPPSPPVTNCHTFSDPLPLSRAWRTLWTAPKPQQAHAIREHARDGVLDFVPETEKHVLDGGSLLHRILWRKAEGNDWKWHVFSIVFHTCHDRLRHHFPNIRCWTKSAFHMLVKGDTILLYSVNAFTVPHLPTQVIDDLGCQVMAVLFIGQSTDSLAEMPHNNNYFSKKVVSASLFVTPERLSQSIPLPLIKLHSRRVYY